MQTGCSTTKLSARPSWAYDTPPFSYLQCIILYHLPRRSFANRLRAWKLGRAHVHGKRKRAHRSNKYSGGDTEAFPKPHQRSQFWVGGYKKRDGTKVKGYMRG